MKWDFFYDENKGAKYQSFADWVREIRPLHYTLIIFLMLVFFGILLLSIFPLL